MNDPKKGDIVLHDNGWLAEVVDIGSMVLTVDWSRCTILNFRMDRS